MKADLIVAGPAADVPKGRHDVFRRCEGSIASNLLGLTGARSHCADPLTILRQEGPAIFPAPQNDDFFGLLQTSTVPASEPLGAPRTHVKALEPALPR